MRTPGPFRLHDMEANTIVAVDKDGHGGEIANTLNGFGDQYANAVFLRASDKMFTALKAARRYVATCADDEVPNGADYALKLLDDALDAADPDRIERADPVEALEARP